MAAATIKQNVLLAKTDSLAPSFKKGIVEYAAFFKGKQGAFLGERKTYEPRQDTIDLPSERGNKLVQTTVDEKLKYLVDTSKAYIDALFSVEATNASGKVQIELTIEGKHFATVSGLELLRLKNLLESSELQKMYSEIPVRSDAEDWEPTTNEMYAGREIFESGKQEGTKKSTTKQQYILPDPNLDKFKGSDLSGYVPQIAVKDTILELGDFSFQRFSGEWSQTQKAKVLSRLTTFLTAVVEALKKANEVEAVQSEVTAEKFFGYINYGTL